MPVSVQRTFVSLAVPPMLAVAAFLLWLLLYARLRIIKVRHTHGTGRSCTRLNALPLQLRNALSPEPMPTLPLAYVCTLFQKPHRPRLRLRTIPPYPPLPAPCALLTYHLSPPISLPLFLFPCLPPSCFSPCPQPRAPSFAEYMDTRFVTTAIVIVFYAYPGITDTLLSIYSCPRLDNDDPGLPYHGLGRAVGVYWEEDYDMRCFAGWHRALALGLGVPGVLLFSCGVPAASAAFLAMRRAQLEVGRWVVTRAVLGCA